MTAETNAERLERCRQFASAEDIDWLIQQTERAQELDKALSDENELHNAMYDKAVGLDRKNARLRDQVKDLEDLLKQERQNAQYQHDRKHLNAERAQKLENQIIAIKILFENEQRENVRLREALYDIAECNLGIIHIAEASERARQALKRRIGMRTQAIITIRQETTEAEAELIRAAFSDAAIVDRLKEHMESEIREGFLDGFPAEVTLDLQLIEDTP
ncbi:hypothetical protein [Sporosarcina trichiuri]|uniref:hypothetical protein n=1 Tax=Sporosarcina trichiuri TaxID=3056445 RepID=UPI0025B4E492|nr:hypothetical protein [Sporosarcina sp. 0.2-SM1T-5]WJY27436.1 hypothetical protein QWT68_15565 [Sporosarcina sp. 0.2-SM1T-5]WJY27456.1 hypothetical protein QWT68_00085 [Sporosarcina sp. 0.2-SM1T-5]